MPTRQRPQKRAPEDPILELSEAASLPTVAYSHEYLRKLMWSPNPPPLFKHRGRWHARKSEIERWAAERDQAAAS